MSFRPEFFSGFNFMLPCVCSITDHRWRQNVIRVKTWHTQKRWSNANVRSQKPFGIAFNNFSSLLTHCWLLGRYYIYSCKYNNVWTFSMEYVNQVRCNLKIEKHVSIITGTQNAFQQRWHKILQSFYSLISPLNFCLNKQFNGMIFRFSFSFEQF